MSDVAQARAGLAPRRAGVDSAVYGGYDGSAAFLDAPEGVIPPPYIAHMTYLGTPPDLVTLALRQLRSQQSGKPRPGVQQQLASLLGVLQQDVSRWQNAGCAPRMTSAQWAVIIRLVIAGNEAAS